MEISPHKDEDAEKWSRTSGPTVENTVYTIDVKEEKRSVRSHHHPEFGRFLKARVPGLCDASTFASCLHLWSYIYFLS